MARWLAWGCFAAGVLAAGYVAALNPDPIVLRVAPSRTLALPLGVVVSAAFAAGALGMGAVALLGLLRRSLEQTRRRRQARRAARRDRRAAHARELVWVGEYDRARSELLRAQEGGETDPERAYGLARGLLETGDAEAAGSLVRDVLARAGDDPNLLELLAEAAERRGDVDAAADALERARRQRPGSPRLLRALRDLHVRARRWSDALAAEERVVVRIRAPEPLDAELHLLHALRYEVALAEPEARHGARILLRLAREEPAFVAAWVSAGDRLAEAGMPVRARRAWSRGAAHRPAAVLLERLESHDAAAGRPGRTSRTYRRLRRRHPDDALLVLLFARHLLRLRDLDGAAALLDGMDAPPAAGLLRGELARLRGDHERAATEFAAALAPGFGLAVVWRCEACEHETSAWCARCERCGRWGTVAAHLRAAVAPAPARAPRPAPASPPLISSAS